MLCSLYPAHRSTTWVNNVAQWSPDVAGLKVLHPRKSFSPGQTGTFGDPTITGLWFGDSLGQKDGFQRWLGLAGVVSGHHCSGHCPACWEGHLSLTTPDKWSLFQGHFPLLPSGPASKNSVNICRNNWCKLEAIFSCKIRNAFLKNREINFKTA